MAYFKKKLELTGVELRKRNFRGEVTDMNERGNRTCLVVLGQQHARDLGFRDIQDMVDGLKADGWVIKRFNATEENDEPDAYMPATAVYYDDNQSNIFLRTRSSRRATLLNKDTVKQIDRADILDVNVILEQHYYNSHGREGFNNRIKSMEVTIDEDAISSRNSYLDDEDDYEGDLPFEGVHR